jgi:peroxiredoxin Q/BCP
MLALGDFIPHFQLLDQHGQCFCTKDIVGQKALVVYFYPKDETRGCTAEACTFRDAYQDFTDAGAEVVGISSDSVKSHRSFAANHQLPYVLLSDPAGKVRKLFGVKGNLLGLVPGRETFVFNVQGQLVHRFRSQIRFREHVQEALKALNKA